MEIPKSFITAVLILAFILVTVQGRLEHCNVSRCGRRGPLIHFPFRLTHSQPIECGSPGFDLYCDEEGKTLVSMPLFPVKFIVHKIDYQKNAVHIIHNPADTRSGIIQNLNLSMQSSPLIQPVPFGIFNCSSSAIYDGGVVLSSLRGAEYQILAIKEDASSQQDVRDTYPPSTCTKIYDVQYSDGIFRFQELWYWSLQIDVRRVWYTRNQRCETLESWYENRIQCSPPPGLSTREIIGLVVGCSVLLVLVIFLTRYYLTRASKSDREIQIDTFLEEHKDRMPTRYTYTEMKKIANQFKDFLGEGRYGKVYKGKLSDGTAVAVKVLESSKGSGEDFINEVSTMANIHHVNVVRLVGFCADGLTQALVFEFLPNGSLDKFISSNMQGNEVKSLSWKKLQEIALGIAKGVEYLHQGCERRIFHFDIKPHNVLLDHNFNPKVCDFGQAKSCAKDQSVVSMTMARGTAGYIAPELFSRNSRFASPKADVYSFGMLLLQMVSCKTDKPAALQSDEKSGQTYLPEWINQRLTHGEDLGVKMETEADHEIVNKLAIVGLWCTQWVPTDRPSMKNVVQMIEGDLASLKMPQMPVAFDSSVSPKTPILQARNFHADLDVITEE